MMKSTLLRIKLTPLLGLLFCFICPATYSAIVTFEFDNAQQEELFHDLSKQLRCPKCQNQNIADSNAQLAQDLRYKTYQLVKQGQSEEEVIDYMVARFGNFVRYDPPMTPATIFLWLGPLLFIVLALYFLYAQIKKQDNSDQALDKLQTLRLQKILEHKKATDNGQQQRDNE